ncbi:MAG TPA: hypothetical protein VG755_05080 [Nannocystaceae bacterium]|nr:hypothetical protein [Nannocystaceae bacterium]
MMLLAALVAVAAQACKKKEGSTTPLQVSDDIASIDAALAQRDQELQSEGIVVAYRGPAPARLEADDTKVEAPVDAPDDGETPDEPDTTEEPVAGPDSPQPGRDFTEVTPSAPPEPAMEPERDEAPRLKSRSHRRARESKRARLHTERDDRRPRSRCERVCELAITTCDLRERVCGLAEDHDDDSRYDEACRRAEDQCDAAMRHCQSCAA